MNRKKQASLLRTVRKIHRWLGATLFIVFLVVSLSGFFLAWKKNSDGYILPKTQKGTTTDVSKWLPIDSLEIIAHKTLQDSISPNLSTILSRIDARPEKGILKFVYDNHHWGIQLDGATGEVLSVGRRHSDWIENVHDGSIIDNALGTKGVIKLLYSSVSGIALLGFTITGFWLWYGPKRMRSQQRKSKS